MADQFYKGEQNQMATTSSKFGGNNSNNPRKLERQKSLAGSNSEGEKSLLKKDPVWLMNPKTKIPVFTNCLNSLDEMLATPSINVSVIGNACDKDFKIFDAINNSKFAEIIDGAMTSFGLFAILIGCFVTQYCKLREKERNSNYFYFYRLFKSFNEEEIKNKMGEIDQDNQKPDDPITYKDLLTVAYFYPRNISKFACWRRRYFASAKEREHLNALNEIFKKYSKEEILNKMHKKITEQVCRLLNHEANLIIFKIKENNNDWTIGLTENYAENFFNKVYPLITANSETTIKEITLDKKYKKIISCILTSLGQASFIYWILVFIFYFIPSAIVVTAASISVIPLGISLFFASLLLIYNILKTNQTFNRNQNIKKEIIETKHKGMLERKLVLLNKQNVYLKFKEKKDANSTVELKNSFLMKKLQEVVKKRRFSKYHAIFSGFLDGCFLPLFVGWLFLDATKVILTYALCPAAALTSFTPIGFLVTAIITGTTLLIGISYGVYLACKAKKVHEKRLNDLENKIKLLVNERGNKRILQEDYDRILRRFSDEKPIWTKSKKISNRLMTFIKRLGTGSLIFRLVMWKPITDICAAVFASSAVPAFFPIILIVGTTLGALAIASWYLYAYNLASKITQVERVMEFFVQNEQLIEINKEPSVLLSESLETQVTSFEVLTPLLENLVVSENDTPFIKNETSQKNISSANENSHLENIDEVINPNKTEIARQRSNSNTGSHGLFKVNFLKNTENMEQCLSPAIIS